MSGNSFEVSMSYLKKMHEDLSLSGFEDNSLFKNLEDSLAYSGQVSQNTSELKQSNQNRSIPKEISFNVSEISKKSEDVLNNLKISQGEDTLPTCRMIPNQSQALFTLGSSLKLLCKTCETTVNSIVSYEITKETWWSSFSTLLKKFHCCGELLGQDCLVVHRCKYCGNILARIFSSSTPSELRFLY
jgi:hypothetical protein